MKFTIITPTYNPTVAHLERCADSVYCQTYTDWEHLIIDDGSTNWLRPDDGYAYFAHKSQIIRLNENCGQGFARNLALEKATGDWILFLDSDDYLVCDALSVLRKHIESNRELGVPPDLVGFNWSDDWESMAPRRKDGDWLRNSKHALVNAYLSLRMDGGPTFTAIRAEALGHLRFDVSKYHEDIAYMFRVYESAQRTSYLDSVIYYKGRHEDAVTSNVSKEHIQCFVKNWARVTAMYASSKRTAYERGVVGAVATRLREIVRHGKPELFEVLREVIPIQWVRVIRTTPLNTLYAQVAKKFIESGSVDPTAFDKKWSCKDLHNSLFLAPDEVRACCKRFFVDGEQRGDVVLLKTSGMPITVHAVRAAKERLLDKINAGEPTFCSKCPYMEFKDWGPVNDNITYLSMEQHSVCNLRCNYCTPKYYEGKTASYDVSGLVLGMVQDGVIGPSTQVVWGGGEPTVGKEFSELSRVLYSVGTRQRILTNAVKKSTRLLKLLRDGSEVVVSIDAGTPGTYLKVRGSDVLEKVLRNVKEFAHINSPFVVIKYILTEDNCSDEEIDSFVMLMGVYGLLECNFQISCDFREEASDGRPVVRLYQMLRGAGAEVVFIDDLARVRLKNYTPPQKTLLGKFAEKFHIVPTTFAAPKRIVAVVGSGDQVTEIMRTKFMEKCEGGIFIDSPLTTHKFPEVPIVIAASQAYPAIYRHLKSLGVHTLVVEGLVL